MSKQKHKFYCPVCKKHHEILREVSLSLQETVMKNHAENKKRLTQK